MSLPATEDFAGGAGVLSASWTQQRTTRRVNRDGSGHGLQDAKDASDVTAFWNADAFADDQYSQYALFAYVSGTSVNLMLRASGSGDSAWNGYDFYTDTQSAAGHTEINKIVAGVATLLGNFTVTFTAGDILRLEIAGSVISLFKNGAFVSSVSDTAITSGSPGLGSWWDPASPGVASTFDNWEGGNMAVAVGQPVRSRKLSTQQRMVA